MPLTRNLSLAACAEQFGALISCTEVTGKNGAPLGIEPGMSASMEMLDQLRSSLGSIYIIGNGGSAGVASHAVIDFVNVAKLRAFTLHDPALLTCMANDYGYENVFARLLRQVAKPGDVLIAISSSGNSMNIRNAAAQMASTGGSVITFSGFSSENPLRLMGDINIWLSSSDYGSVEIGHQFILHNMADRFGAGYGKVAAQ